jgi:EmrB/QacA subfamily drug resistance transporter
MVNKSQSRVRPPLVLLVLSGAAFMASLDLFIVNVAFDAIGRDLEPGSIGNLSWILNGYAIVYAGLLVPLGQLADRFGRRAGFLLGLAVFTAASAACAASTTLWLLVAFRLLQAVGAAALTPTSLGLLLPVFPPERRARAVQIWSAAGALAAAAGPVIGGLLLQASWRWVFLVNVPIGIAALVATVLLVPDSRDTTDSRLPDLAGAVVAAAGVSALALGLVKGPDWGWLDTRTVLAFVGAAVGLALFWWRCEHHPSPVVEPALVRVRPFAWANGTAIAFSAAFAANLLTLVLWLQQVWHWSAIKSGLAVAPGPLMVPLLAVVAVIAGRRRAPGQVAAIGCVAFAAGMLLTLTRLTASPNYLDILPGLLVGGAGVGFALPTILSSATADLPPDRAATGSAVINMSRQVGSVLGVSVAVALIGTPLTYAHAHAVFQHAWWACAAVALLAAVIAPRMSPPPVLQPAGVADHARLDRAAVGNAAD